MGSKSVDPLLDITARGRQVRGLTDALGMRARPQEGGRVVDTTKHRLIQWMIITVRTHPDEHGNGADVH